MLWISKEMCFGKNIFEWHCHLILKKNVKINYKTELSTSVCIANEKWLK